MRSVCVLLAALFVVPTIGATAWEEPRDDLAVTVMRMADSFVHVSWTAAPGALAYQIHRGPTLDELEFVATTPALEYVDGHAPAENTWYVVVSTFPLASNIGPDPMRGKCVAMRGITGVSVTVAHCLPHL